MSLSCRPYRLDQTRHGSTVLLFLPSWSKSLWQPQRLRSHAVLPFYYASVDSETSSSSCRLLLVAFFVQFSSLVRFGRSSCSCLFFKSFRRRSSRAPVVVPPLAVSLLAVWAVILLVIDPYVHTSYTPLNCFFPPRHYSDIRSLCISLPPTPSAWFGSVSCLASLVDRVLRVLP